MGRLPRPRRAAAAAREAARADHDRGGGPARAAARGGADGAAGLLRGLRLAQRLAALPPPVTHADQPRHGARAARAAAGGGLRRRRRRQGRLRAAAGLARLRAERPPHGSSGSLWTPPPPHRAAHRTSWSETVYRCRCVVYDDMGAPQVAELLRLLLTIAACCWVARVRTSYIDKHFGKHFDKRGSRGAAAGA